MISNHHGSLTLISRRGFAALPDGRPMGEVVTGPDGRPDFMILLGLLPPYTEDDVHKAYKAKAAEAHPDRGGSQEAFLELQEAYEHAQDYVKFTEGRRLWLANQVEPYLRQQEILAEIEQRGGTVELETVEWMQRSFGDFAALADRLKGIVLRDAWDGDAFLRYLADNGKDLRFLVSLDLSGSRLTDAGLVMAQHLRSLQRLNVSNTKITARGLEVLQLLPDLALINVHGTSVGWLARRKLGKILPHTRIVSEKDA